MSCARKEIPSEFSSLFCISIHKQLSMTPRSKIESNPNIALGHPFWSNFTYSNFSLAHPLSYSLSLKSLPGLDKGLVEVLDRNFFSPSLRIPLLQTCTLRWPKLEICRPFMSAHLTTFSVKFLFFFLRSKLHSSRSIGNATIVSHVLEVRRRGHLVLVVFLIYEIWWWECKLLPWKYSYCRVWGKKKKYGRPKVSVFAFYSTTHAPPKTCAMCWTHNLIALRSIRLKKATPILSSVRWSS